MLALMIFGATVLSTTLHELLGHGLACVSAGGSVTDVRVAAGGGGYCNCDHPKGELSGLVAAAGIAIDLVTGTITFGLSRRIRNRFVALFLLVHAGVACLGALLYLAFGLFYGVGDPGSIVERLELGSIVALHRGDRAIWIPFAIALPFVAFAMARHYREKQARFLGQLPLGKTLAVLGVVMVSLGVCLASLPSSHLAYDEAAGARSSGELVTKLMATAKATRAELAGQSAERIQAALEERLSRIERPTPEPRAVQAFAMFLFALAGLGALAGIIWSRGRGGLRGEGAASPSAT